MKSELETGNGKLVGSDQIQPTRKDAEPADLSNPVVPVPLPCSQGLSGDFAEVLPARKPAFPGDSWGGQSPASVQISSFIPGTTAGVRAHSSSSGILEIFHAENREGK